MITTFTSPLGYLHTVPQGRSWQVTAIYAALHGVPSGGDGVVLVSFEIESSEGLGPLINPVVYYKNTGAPTLAAEITISAAIGLSLQEFTDMRSLNFPLPNIRLPAGTLFGLNASIPLATPTSLLFTVED